MIGGEVFLEVHGVCTLEANPAQAVQSSVAVD